MKRLCLGLLILALPGCARMATSTSRFGKDVAVVVTSPAEILCGGVEDALTYRDDRSVNAAFSPVLVPVMMGKHVYFTLVYAIDTVWYPIYLPLGLEPIDLYQMTRFPWKTEAEGHKWIHDELFEGVDEER